MAVVVLTPPFWRQHGQRQRGQMAASKMPVRVRQLVKAIDALQQAEPVALRVLRRVSCRVGVSLSRC